MSLPASLFIAWHPATQGIRKGRFEVRNGSAKAHSRSAYLRVEGSEVELHPGGAAIAKVELAAPASRYGKNATILRWVSQSGGFSLLPVMLPKDHAISIPDYGVTIGRTLEAVTCKEEARTPTHEGAAGPADDEPGWDLWAERNRSRISPTILGLSRDHRLFEVNLETDTVKGSLDFKTRTVEYYLCRASTAAQHLERSLEAGAYPILHARENVGDLLVEETMFSTFADCPLTEESVQGTPLDVAHLFSVGATFPEGAKEAAQAHAKEYQPEGEVALYLRMRVTNQSNLPLLAPQRFPRAFQFNEAVGHAEEMKSLPRNARLDERGVAWTGERPFSLHRINGEVPESLQPCLLLEPGESMVLDSILSHRPEGLGETVQKQEIHFEEKMAEAAAFWRAKLGKGGITHLPEERLQQLWKAGHAHLELVTLGEHQGPLLPKVGIYTAIGSESIPIVEFYHSIGEHETARRCVESFLQLQHESGRINLFLHYDIETGAILHLMGLHFAYTRDLEWVRRHAGAIKKAVSYLKSLRYEGSPSDIRNGLIAGACADPVETPVAFMLNAYNASGFAAAARLLEALHDPESGACHELAQTYADQLRTAMDDAFARGPVLPVSQERWVPTCAPWAGGDGVQAMGLDGEGCFTHGTYMVYDALLGPLHAVYLGVLPWSDRRAEWLLEINGRHLNRGAIAESQPYYSRHPEVHLLRGERTEFLNAFYSGITAMADRETFTFEEHLFRMSLHKTHEEGWALMQLRRMLWLEAGPELRLLSGIPSSWLKPGSALSLERCGSYFGEFSFTIRRSDDGRTLLVRWSPRLHTEPGALHLHLPGCSLEAVAGAGSLSPGGIILHDPMHPAEVILTLQTLKERIR